jgi:hypothetical protein
MMPVQVIPAHISIEECIFEGSGQGKFGIKRVVMFMSGIAFDRDILILLNRAIPAAFDNHLNVAGDPTGRSQ